MNPTTYRTYGSPPYHVAVIHGGPGAAGEMAPVARRLAESFGTLEPLQTADTVAGQVDELTGVMNDQTSQPTVLIGHSWGAWLSWLTAAHHPDAVSGLILVGCPPFDTSYVSQILEARLSRLSDGERRTFEELRITLDQPNPPEDALARLGALVSKSDNVHPIEERNNDEITVDSAIFSSVWPEAAEMRSSGHLLDLARRISCPVVAIHGRQDPHPFAGVAEPLSTRLEDFRIILLENCGHTPWIEKRARARFGQILRKEILTLLG